MSDSKDLPITEQLTKLSKTMGEVVITDVLNKYDVKPEHRRQLSPEQKAEIKNLVEDIKAQVESLLQQSIPKPAAAPPPAPATETSPAATSTPAVPAAPARKAPRTKKRRLRLRVKRNENPENSTQTD